MLKTKFLELNVNNYYLKNKFKTYILKMFKHPAIIAHIIKN